MTRIICIGHPLMPADQAGPRVYQELSAAPLPAGVELIDGGLQGLNLLRFFEDCSKVILVDSLKGFLDTSGVAFLHGDEIFAAVADHFDHSAGLAYLLAMLPQLLPNPPQLELIGIEGDPTSALVEQAAHQVRQRLKHRSAA